MDFPSPPNLESLIRNSPLRKNRSKACAFICSLLYTLKIIRNRSLSSQVEFSESLKYSSDLFQAIYHYNVGDVVYLQGRKHIDKKYKIITVIGEVPDESYEVELFSEDTVFSSTTKFIIQRVDIKQIYSKTTTVSIIEFREKYENLFIFGVIFLCFLNCLQIALEEDPKFHRWLTDLDYIDPLFKRIKVSIKRCTGFKYKDNKWTYHSTEDCFLNLDVDHRTSTGSPFWTALIKSLGFNETDTTLNQFSGLKDTIVRIHKTILESVFLIRTNVFEQKLFGKGTTKQFSDSVNLFTKYFVDSGTGANLAAYTNLSDTSTFEPKKSTTRFFDENMKDVQFPAVPIQMKFQSGTAGGGNHKIIGGGSVSIDLFKISCKILECEPDSLLTALKMSLNQVTSDLTFGSKNKTQQPTGLSMYERNTITQPLNSNYTSSAIPLGIGFGGSRRKIYYNKKNRTNKMYKGGVYTNAATLVAGQSVFMSLALYQNLLAQGLVLTAPHAHWLGHGANAGAAILATYVGPAAPVVGIPWLPIVAGIAVVGGITYYMYSSDSSLPAPESTIQVQLTAENIAQLQRILELNAEQYDKFLQTSQFIAENSSMIEQHYTEYGLTRQQLDAIKKFNEFLESTKYTAEHSSSAVYRSYTDLGLTQQQLKAIKKFNRLLKEAKHTEKHTSPADSQSYTKMGLSRTELDENNMRGFTHLLEKIKHQRETTSPALQYGPGLVNQQPSFQTIQPPALPSQEVAGLSTPLLEKIKHQRETTSPALQYGPGLVNQQPSFQTIQPPALPSQEVAGLSTPLLAALGMLFALSVTAAYGTYVLTTRKNNKIKEIEQKKHELLKLETQLQGLNKKSSKLSSKLSSIHSSRYFEIEKEKLNARINLLAAKILQMETDSGVRPTDSGVRPTQESHNKRYSSKPLFKVEARSEKAASEKLETPLLNRQRRASTLSLPTLSLPDVSSRVNKSTTVGSLSIRPRTVTGNTVTEQKEAGGYRKKRQITRKNKKYY